MPDTLHTISAADLICMNDHADTHHYRIDLAYARADNVLFGERIYREGVKLWLHKDLADIVKRAAQECFTKHDYRFVLYDGLRTVDAQKAMMQTQRVRNNPHWLEPPRLLSPAGSGGHPRAMAIDIALEDKNGELIDMGTPFDFLAENASAVHNPAHRDHPHSAEIMNNRKILDECMMQAARDLQTPLLPLPEEWWDFRLPADIYNQYKPLSDFDLPEDMRLLDI